MPREATQLFLRARTHNNNMLRVRALRTRTHNNNIPSVSKRGGCAENKSAVTPQWEPGVHSQ